MVSPQAAALDNPLILLRMLSTPQGRQAAAVLLAQEGVTPEHFIMKVRQAPDNIARQRQALSAPTGQGLANEIGQEGIRPPGPQGLPPQATQGAEPMAYDAPIFTGAQGAGWSGNTFTPAASQGGGFNADALIKALGSVKAPAAPPPPQYIGGGGIPQLNASGGLSPQAIEELIRLALAGQGGLQAPQPVPTLGQMFAGSRF